MSKIIEEAALEYCRENDIEVFCSGDIGILHNIYDRASLQKGFKVVKNNHPCNILRRVRNSMRTGYYFNRSTGVINGRKISFYKMSERCRRRVL